MCSGLQGRGQKHGWLGSLYLTPPTSRSAPPKSQEYGKCIINICSIVQGLIFNLAVWLAAWLNLAEPISSPVY